MLPVAKVVTKVVTTWGVDILKGLFTILNSFCVKNVFYISNKSWTIFRLDWILGIVGTIQFNGIITNSISWIFFVIWC